MADEYEIEKIGDLLNVPVEKWDALLLDVRAWMEFRSGVRRDFGPLIDSGVLTLPESMTWVDDDTTGLSSLTIDVEILPTAGSEGG